VRSRRRTCPPEAPSAAAVAKFPLFAIKGSLLPFDNDDDLNGLSLKKQLSSDLDAMRGLAAITVAAAHSVQIWIIPYVGYKSLTSAINGIAAAYAVNVFFVLSGFMIAQSAARHRRDDGCFLTMEFFKARAYRLLPPYYFAVLLTFVVVGLIHLLALYGAQAYRLPGDVDIVRENAAINWEAFPWFMTLSYGLLKDKGSSLLFDGPLWTLSAEWAFYVLVTLWCDARFNGRLAAGLTFGIAVVTFLIWGSPIFLTFAAIWCLGFVLGNSVERVRTAAVVVVALLFAAGFFLSGLGDFWARLSDPYSDVPSRLMFFAGGGLIACLIAWRSLAQGESRLPGWAQSTARWSYTLYLVHFPILMLGFSLTRPITHPYGLPADALNGFAWLIVAMIVVSKIAPVVEDRWMLRGWFERRRHKTA
jgi:peptidoglycan/LPS O-acetylase OafA/YrhL